MGDALSDGLWRRRATRAGVNNTVVRFDEHDAVGTVQDSDVCLDTVADVVV